MKTRILTLVVTALAVVSCSAMPPLHKPVPTVSTNGISANAPTGGDPITHINFYKADVADTSWTLVASVPATNGSVNVTAPPTTQPWFSTAVYVAESTNVQTKLASDYSVPVTNAVSGPPSTTLATPTTPALK